MNIRTIICTAIVLFVPVFQADAAPRKVMIENFTATWCQYCPDVANGLILLMDEFPDTCFSMQVHGGDSYATTWGNQRNNFYNVPGYPTVWIDGTLNIAGSYGSANANYQQLRNRYLQRIATSTDVTLDSCGFSVDNNTYTVSSNIGIEAGGVGKKMIIHCAQVLQNYPSGSYNYACFMQAQSTTISLGAGTSQTIDFTFDLNAESAASTSNVTFYVWAQSTNSSGPSNVYQAERHQYNEIDCTIDTFVVGPKGDFATIGDALDASGSGDTILVSPGTYNEIIDYAGGAITIRSTNGANVTTIDGGGEGSVVRMYGSPVDTTILDGFTIMHGDYHVGGGMHTDGSPQILNCKFMNNAAILGGAISHLDNGTVGPMVANTYFCGNTPDDIYGDWVDGGGNVFDDSCGGSDCPSDVTGDGWVNVTDILAVIAAWGTNDSDSDVNGDGDVDVSDILQIVGSWGPCE